MTYDYDFFPHDDRRHYWYIAYKHFDWIISVFSCFFFRRKKKETEKEICRKYIEMLKKDLIKKNWKKKQPKKIEKKKTNPIFFYKIKNVTNAKIIASLFRNERK